MGHLGPLKLALVPSGKPGRSTIAPDMWEKLLPLIREHVGRGKRMTQRDLAKQMGLSASAISQWLEGGNRPDPWNALRALQIVGADRTKVRAYFYGLSESEIAGNLLGNLADAIGVQESSLTALGTDSGRSELMGLRDEVRRAALAVMVLEGRALHDVLLAAQVAQDKQPNVTHDAIWWVGLITAALAQQSESGERESVKGLLAAKLL